METLNAYQSSDEEANEENNDDLKVQARLPDREFLQAAPSVSLTAGRDSTALTIVSHQQPRPEATKDGQLMMHNNPKKELMYQPEQGPLVDPSTKSRKRSQPQIVSNVAVDATDFDEQRVAFARTGTAINPIGQIIQRSTIGYTNERLEAFAQDEARKRQRPINETTAPIVHGSDDEAEYGIWAPPSTEERWAVREGKTSQELGEMTEEQQVEHNQYHERKRKFDPNYDGTLLEENATTEDSKMAHLLPDETKQENKRGPIEATTTFHGESEVDYKGRSWIAAPAGLGSVRADGGASDHTCYVPKQCVHRFSGHENGVHRIRLFPITGHLLLSAGLDGTCKVWSVAEKQLMRTYSGHKAAVRDVQFNRDGTKFVSASFDRYVVMMSLFLFVLTDVFSFTAT